MRADLPTRTTRKILRILGVVGSVAVLLFAVIVLIIALAFPSSDDLRARYFSARLQAPVVTTEPISLQMRSTETVSGTTQAPSEPPARTVPAQTPAPVSLSDYAVERFVARGDRSLRVCDTLAIPQATAAPVDTASFGRAIETQIRTDQPNAFVESALAPLGAVLQLPAVGDVATSLRNAELADDPVGLRDAQFYSQVAFAAASVYRNKPTLDTVSQHAYHLSVLSKIVRLAPGVANQSEFTSLCSLIETRALDPSSSAFESVDDEKSEMLNLIGMLGLAPQQVGYDPSLDTRLAINITPQAVMVSSPWMDQMFKSGLALAAPVSAELAR